MVLYTRESLDRLRERVDLVDLVGSYIELKRAGTAYKGLCPFHEEKSPSFMIQKGQRHYHCFGCGAHGDAIQFLMVHGALSFQQSVELLAERYGLLLEKAEGDKGAAASCQKKAMKQALEEACRLYQLYLLHTEEGHEACRYLFDRSIGLEMIRRFRLGLAPSDGRLLIRSLAEEGFSSQQLQEAGLLTASGRDLFQGRITFPIADATGTIVGFSARKWREETFGGKYVNTPETPLFKKGELLFGLHFSRRRIAKEQRAIVVEGQLDGLRLIHHGLDLTVAGQGTAFGAGQLRELQRLGVRELFLAFDGDNAGRQAAFKVGDKAMAQRMGVRIVRLPEGEDPDGFVRTHGIEPFLQLLKEAQDYLAFAVEQLSLSCNMGSPAGKTALVAELRQQLSRWDDKVLIHESLRYLARLLDLPEETLSTPLAAPSTKVARSSRAGFSQVDGDRILEGELLRWLLLSTSLYPHFIPIAEANLSPESLRNPHCRQLYEALLEEHQRGGVCDLFCLTAIALEEKALQQLLEEITQRKVNSERAEELYRATLQKLLNREWMEQREKIRRQIQSGSCSEEQLLALVAQFDQLKQTPPQLHWIDKESLPSRYDCDDTSLEVLATAIADEPAIAID